MRKIISLLAFLPLLGLFYACYESSGQTLNSESFSNSNAQNNPDYWLLTDPEADLYNYIRTSGTIDGRSKLFIFNHKQRALLIYDTKSRELEKKIQYDHQGPNALNALFPMGGIRIIDKDSILFYSSLQSIIYLSDYDGNVYKRTRIKNDSVGFGSVGRISKMAIKDHQIWMQSLPHTIGEFELDYKNRPNMFGSIDLETGLTQEYLLDYPEVYSGNDFSQSLQMADVIYNPTIDKFIVSFPLSHDIYVTDFKGDTKAYPAKSKLIGKPIATDNNRKDINPSAITNHYYWINDSYGELFYDPISNHYFREARKGISEANLAAKEFESQKEILVFDKDFKQVAVLPHHGGTLMYHFFDSNQIYWNANFNKYNFERENEDTIYFEKRRFY